MPICDICENNMIYSMWIQNSAVVSASCSTHSFASRPHPSVSGLVMTVCACVFYVYFTVKSNVYTTPIKIYKPRIRVLTKNMKLVHVYSAFYVVSGLSTREMGYCTACAKDIFVPRLMDKLTQSIAFEWKYTVSIRWYPNSQENLGKLAHAQTVNTRPVTEGCGYLNMALLSCAIIIYPKIFLNCSTLKIKNSHFSSSFFGNNSSSLTSITCKYKKVSD